MKKKSLNSVKCPKCGEKMKETPFTGVRVESCNKCKGYWFEKGELRKAKDKKEEGIKWMDVDLWEKEENFNISKDKKECPDCGVPLYEVNYGDSKVKVDVCNLCEGVWLDEGEFKKIVNYLKKDAGNKIMNEYGKVLLEEIGEIFVGPEPLDEEIEDVITVLGLLKYRFAGKHPFISRAINSLPKS